MDRLIDWLTLTCSPEMSIQRGHKLDCVVSPNLAYTAFLQHRVKIVDVQGKRHALMFRCLRRSTKDRASPGGRKAVREGAIADDGVNKRANVLFRYRYRLGAVVPSFFETFVAYLPFKYMCYTKI